MRASRDRTAAPAPDEQREPSGGVDERLPPSADAGMLPPVSDGSEIGPPLLAPRYLALGRFAALQRADSGSRRHASRPFEQYQQSASGSIAGVLRDRRHSVRTRSESRSNRRRPASHRRNRGGKERNLRIFTVPLALPEPAGLQDLSHRSRAATARLKIVVSPVRFRPSPPERRMAAWFAALRSEFGLC